MSKVPSMPMPSKIEVVAGPIAVATGSGFLTLQEYIEEGLPLLIQYGNGLLIFFGLLLMISNIRNSRLVAKKLKIEIDNAEGG